MSTEARILAGRFAQGDVGAFEELEMLERKRLYGHLLHECKYDVHRAQDAYQELWAKAIPAIRNGEYDPERPFRPWILGVAHRVLLEQNRKKGRWWRNIFRLGAKLAEEEPAPDAKSAEADARAFRRGTAPPLEILIRRESRQEMRTAIQSAVDQLPPDQREVFILHAKEELTFDEIAATDPLTPKATLVRRFQRAAETLRGLLWQFRPGRDRKEN